MPQKGYKKGPDIKCGKCGKVFYVHPKKEQKYCSRKCYASTLAGTGNPFYGKKHNEETIKKIQEHPNQKNRRTTKGYKHTKESIKKMSKPRKKPSKLWHWKYNNGFKAKGSRRAKILKWCTRFGGEPSEIETIWDNPCSSCGFSDVQCDLHHRIPRKEGGGSGLDNILVLCPNCHRVEHLKDNPPVLCPPRNNSTLRPDFDYYGQDRQKILGWVRRNGGDPNEIAELWFKPCQICGWDEAKCDLHHHIPKNKGGESTIENLMVLCPNHHRIEHTNGGWR